MYKLIAWIDTYKRGLSFKTQNIAWFNYIYIHVYLSDPEFLCDVNSLNNCTVSKNKKSTIYLLTLQWLVCSGRASHGSGGALWTVDALGGAAVAVHLSHRRQLHTGWLAVVSRRARARRLRQPVTAAIEVRWAREAVRGVTQARYVVEDAQGAVISWGGDGWLIVGNSFIFY